MLACGSAIVHSRASCLSEIWCVQVQSVLIEFQNHQDAWQRVPAILEQSANPNTKLIALNILDACVKTRWRVLAADQREAIKMFLIQLIIKLSSDDDSLKANQAYLKRLNISLVQVRGVCL
jgi:exportin-1